MLADADRLHHTVDQVLKAGVGAREAEGGRTRPGGHGGADPRVRRPGARCGTTCSRARSRSRRTAATPLIVRGDADELRTVITNLLDNAVKYSAGAGARSRCRWRRRRPTRCGCGSQDRGVGIPKKQLKRIFNRFYRVQTRGLKQVKGTGLGLYIVRSIARAHGGRVFAQSEGEGRGATFTLELPRLAG